MSETTYPIYKPAEFRYLGYERRDEGTQPRVLVTGITRLNRDEKVLFHIAGDEFERWGELPDVVRDSDLVSGMEPDEALRLGYNWRRMIERNRPPIPADAASAAAIRRGHVHD